MGGRGRIDMTEQRFVDCFKGLVDYLYISNMVGVCEVFHHERNGVG